MDYVVLVEVWFMALALLNGSGVYFEPVIACLDFGVPVPPGFLLMECKFFQNQSVEVRRSQ